MILGGARHAIEDAELVVWVRVADLAKQRVCLEARCEIQLAHPFASLTVCVPCRAAAQVHRASGARGSTGPTWWLALQCAQVLVVPAAVEDRTINDVRSFSADISCALLSKATESLPPSKRSAIISSW